MNLDSATASLQMRLRQEPGQPARPLFTSEHFTAWLKHCEAVLGRVDKYAIKIDGIRNDTSRTLQGQQAQYADLAPQVVKEIGPLAVAPLNEVNGAMSRLNHLLFDPITAVPKDGDPTILFLREQELRQRIPKGEETKAYLNALASDDLETVRAIYDAPGAPWLTEESRRRGEAEYAKRTNPTAYAQRESLDYFKDHLQSLVAQVRTWFLAMGASPESVDAVLGD